MKAIPLYTEEDLNAILQGYIQHREARGLSRNDAIATALADFKDKDAGFEATFQDGHHVGRLTPKYRMRAAIHALGLCDEEEVPIRLEEYRMLWRIMSGKFDTDEFKALKEEELPS